MLKEKTGYFSPYCGTILYNSCHQYRIVPTGGLMLSKNDSNDALKKLFHRHKVVDLKTLYKTLKTKSRMSVFRRLQEFSYLSSYTHAGRYYTHSSIPQFDINGLWFFQGIGFSIFNTLKNTIIEIVKAANQGMTHSELYALLQVRVQDTLLSLVHGNLINRHKVDGTYLYLSVNDKRAQEQLSQRSADVQIVKSVPDTLVIEVLTEVIHASDIHASPSLVAKRLSTRGIYISTEQIEHVFGKYEVNVKKK